MNDNGIPADDAHTPGPQPYGPQSYGPGPGSGQGPPAQGARPQYGAQGPSQQPGASDRFFHSIRQIGIVRTQDRWVGGVAGGVAQRFGLDPLLVRGLLAVSFLIAGVGLVLYALAWAFLPEEGDGRIHAEGMVHGHFDGAVLGVLVLLILGFSWDVSGIFPFSWYGNWFGGLLWFAAIGGLIALIIVSVNKQRGSDAGRYAHASFPTRPHPSNDGSGGHGWGTDRSGAYSYDSGAYNSGAYDPTGTGGSGGTAPPTPIYSPRPKPPSPVKVLGPGVRMVGVLLGLWVLSVAGLLIAERTGHLTVSVGALSTGLLVGITGIGVVIAGLRGRSAGALGVIAVFAIIFSLPTTIWSTTNLSLGDATKSGLSSAAFSPTTVADARNGYAMVAGDWVLDLRELPTSNRVVEVPVTMAAGDLTVKMPDDVAWQADVRLLAGEISMQTPTDGTTRGGLFPAKTTFSADAVIEGADPTLQVVIRGAAGQITIIQEES